MKEWNIKNYSIEDGFCGEFTMFREFDGELKESVLFKSDFKLFINKDRIKIYYNKNKYIIIIDDVDGNNVIECYCDGLENLIDFMEFIEIILILVDDKSE
jgi:hypothetical protein